MTPLAKDELTGPALYGADGIAAESRGEIQSMTSKPARSGVLFKKQNINANNTGSIELGR